MKQFLTTVTIWMPNTWLPDSMGVRYYMVVTWLGRPFEYQIFWTINRLFQSGFQPSFKYQTIWQPNTNQPFENQISPVFRWLLYSKFALLLFSHLSSLIDGEGDAASGEDDNCNRVVVVLVTDPQTYWEELKDVERIQHLLHQEVDHRVIRDQNVV